MHHVSLAFQCIYGCNDERGEDGDRKEVSEIPGGDDLILCGEWEKYLRAMVRRF